MTVFGDNMRLLLGLRLFCLWAAVCVLASAPSAGDEHGLLDGAGVSVRQFGARGDGQHDDTEAIQKACRSPLRAVVFPAGNYRITRTIVVDLQRHGYKSLIGLGNARLTMAGKGPAVLIVGTHQGTADPHTVRPGVWQRERMPVVRGIEIVGQHPEADGLALRGTMQTVISHVLIRHVRHGIHLVERNRNVIIESCHIYENSGVGIFYDDVNLHQSNIVGCHISYNRGGGIVSRAGNVRNIHITGCDIESNMGEGGPVTANVLLDSTGGSVGEVAIVGCTIQHNPHGPQSANIRIVGVGHDEGIARRTGSGRTHEGHVTIVGNVFSDVQINVHVQGARGVVITGNTFWQAYTADLLIEDSSHIVVGPNNFDQNPRYDYRRLLSKGGVILKNSRNCTLTGIQIDRVRDQPASLLLRNCSRIHVSGCTVSAEGMPAVLVEGSRDCLLRGFFSSSGARPVIVRNSERIRVDGAIPAGEQ